MGMCMHRDQHSSPTTRDTRLARRPVPVVSEGDREIRNRENTPSSDACLRVEARSGFLFEGRPGLGPRIKKQSRSRFMSGGGAENSEPAASFLPALTEEAVTSKGFFLRSMVTPEYPDSK